MILFRAAMSLSLLTTLLIGGAAVPASAEETTASQLAARLVTANESSLPYDRALFEHWVDEDSNGCDTRQEVLILESQVEPTMGAGCAVMSGLWYSWYDGAEWTNPADVDIDHLVALAEAWQSGAHAWTPAKRRAYANDLGLDASLEAVTDDVNSAKGSSDPAQWLPPLAEVHCDYAIEWLTVKYRWSLALDATERSAINAVLDRDGCGNTPVLLPLKADIDIGAEPRTSGDSLYSGETLLAGEELWATDGSHVLAVQADGNVVVYTATGRALWASRTAGAGNQLVMQGDGNLVAYSSTGKALWASGTSPAGNRLVMQIDGNAVIYTFPANRPVWASASSSTVPPSPAPPTMRDSLSSGATLSSGEQLVSINGVYSLPVQSDGNLVAYRSGVAYWSTGTSGAGMRLVMQIDGNLVLYTSSGVPTWASGTSGNPGAWVALQDDGNIVIYRANGTAAWASYLPAAAPLPAQPPAPTPGPMPSQPANPGDTKNCADFSTQRGAQSWFDTYYPYYGDVAQLDSDNDRVACEGLP